MDKPSRCSTCIKTFEKNRAPHGWKRKGEALYCPECWRENYILRAITMLIASCSWGELRKDLHVLYGETTACSNWMMTELYARDVRRNGQPKMPPMPRAYLYPEARVKFPSLPPQTVASLEQACQRKYRSKRYEVLWTCAASLPTFRYPTPLPVHNQSWRASLDERVPYIEIRLSDGWKKFRLKGGPHYRRQLVSFHDIVAGRAFPGELAIFESAGVLKVKMVAWLPRQPKQDATGVLRVTTQKDSLLLAVNAKDETLWRYNGDHLRRWITEHSRKLQRWSEDEKFEQRPNDYRLRRDVATFQQRREEAVTNQFGRMASALHEIAFQLATYARRRKFAGVLYDDSEKTFLGARAPWFRLAQLIEEKLDAFGIEFEHASAPAPDKSGEPLAEEQTDAES